MDIITLALAKSFATKVAAGYSKVEVDGMDIIFTLNDGSQVTLTVPTPADGVSVVDLDINENNELICTMSDGNSINAGEVPVADLSEYAKTEYVDVKNELIEEELKKVEMIYNALPKVNGNGTEITLNDTAECPIYSINLGASEIEQITTTGKNYLNPADYTSGGADVTFANDVIRVYSIRTNTSPLVRYIYDVQENDVVRLNGIIQSAQGRFVLQTSENGTDYTTVSDSTKNYIDGETVSSIEYTVPTGVTKIRFLLYSDKAVPSGDSESDYKNVIVTINNSDMTYERYTGGQLSPSPSYQQQIHTISGDNTITISNSDDTEEQNFSIALDDLEYCKIGSYEDLFFKNVEESEYYDNTLQEDKWYLKKKIGKITDGIGSTGKTINNMISNSTVYSYCGGTVSGTTITYSSALTVDNTIYYPLSTATDILLNNTLQTQLDNIQKANSYQNQTNINQTNNDLPFTLSIAAIKDLSSL